MSEFLIFTLTAPLASFGELAGNSRRGTLHWPGKSAILGLLGAALGIRRDDEAGQKALAGWQVAVSVLGQGVPLRDYHTVQTVPSAKAHAPNSRRAAFQVAGRDLNTMITQRDYLTDTCFGVALWAAPLPLPLTEVAEALRHPVFTLYQGRKCCPLCAPLAPKIATAQSPIEALSSIILPVWLNGLNPAKPVLVASDPFAGALANRQTQRWDTPLDRKRWHFSPRLVDIHTTEGNT